MHRAYSWSAACFSQPLQIRNKPSMQLGRKNKKKKSEIYTGTRRLVVIVQEYEKLCARFAWGHKELQLNQKKCPCNSTLQCIQSEKVEGDLLGQGNKRSHWDWGEGWVEIGLRKHLKLIQLTREKSSVLSFVCLSILSLLNYVETLSKITLGLQWVS